MHWFCAVTERSWRFPWTFFTSQLVLWDAFGLAIHASVLLNVGQAVVPAIGAANFYKVYFASGAAYDLAELVWCSATGVYFGASVGPAGTLIGLAAALASTSANSWSPPADFSFFGVNLGPEQLVAAMMGLHLVQHGARALPGCVAAALAGYYLGGFYAVQWRLSAIGTIDSWLDFALRGLF